MRASGEGGVPGTRAVAMFLIGAADPEHAFFSTHAGIGGNVIFLLPRRAVRSRTALGRTEGIGT